MTNAANTNLPPVEAGRCYYPEMGERAAPGALFHTSTGYKGVYVKWTEANNAAALAAFKRLRIRPRWVDLGTMLDGSRKWTCTVTWEAGNKLLREKLAVRELLLD
jgi:hypothetical protein